MGVKLSPSRLDLFMECERCFWLQMNENIERPRQPFPSLPSGIDGKVKEHFDRFRGKEEKPPELRGTELELFDGQNFVDYARSWNTEPKWRDRETGAVLRGGLDELLVNEEGEMVVLDYKTKGYEPENEVPDYYRRQVELYSLILEENGYRTADQGVILYFYPDSFTRDGGFNFHTELKRTDIDTERAKKVVRDAVKTTEGSLPGHGESCDYCEWEKGRVRE